MGNHMGHCSDVSARISNSHNTQTASASGPSKITSKTMSTSAVFCFFLASGASKVTTKTKPTSEVPTLTIPPYQEQKATKRLPPTRFEGEKAHLHRKRLSPPRSEGEKAHLHRKRLSPPRSEGEKAHLHRKRLSPPRPEVSGASKVTSKPESTSANSSLTGPSFNKKSTTKGLPLPRSEGEILSSPNLKAFSFGELRNATRNFRPDSLLGEGGFGYVFKGWIDEHTFSAVKPGSGMVVAVKKLKPEGFQGHKEWLTEVNYLGQLHHPNLVKLIGYCLDGENRLLVYEFMPKGSLENHLFRRGTQPLSWEIRIKVAIGAARGLSFLHDAESQVIYRDVKASNILLDAEFNAKLSDFGLAKAGPTGDRTHVSTQVMGTHGYAAPEYMATGRLSAKSDVYSFGVVLLELLTGRHAVDKTRVSAEQNLVDWARQYLVDKRKLFRIMDTKLEGQYSQKGAFMAANLALHCLNHGPKARPRMAEVLAKLEQIQALKRRTQFEKQEASNANQRSPLRHHHLPHDQPASNSPLPSPGQAPSVH